mgnify:CR=1 FL=1
MHLFGHAGRFLYEPNASVMKCGGFRSLATRYGLRKLHPNSHLYTSDHSCKDFPGGRLHRGLLRVRQKGTERTFKRPRTSQSDRP